jgi:hypothetical protein
VAYGHPHPIGFVQSMKLGRHVFKNQRRLAGGDNEKMNLRLTLGEVVEVRSLKEIFAALDENGELKGLAFNHEMAKFCRKRFRVYRRLDKIILESTGELRRIKTPTVMLEGVFCDGQAHGKCDRSCFCSWREAWLRRVESYLEKADDPIIWNHPGFGVHERGEKADNDSMLPQRV